MSENLNYKNRKSFTLIELLIVLAIVAILSVVVILTLNPSELLKQARDSNRLSDLSTINSALGVFNTDVPGGLMGTPSVVYVSIADTTTTCANLGLPTPPTGWTYNCATQANLKKNDGTGWIPVNFKQITFGSPLSNLPVDPINTTTTGQYYTYVTGGSWELTSIMESAKQKSLTGAAGTDGGRSWNSYEVGSNLTLTPIQVLDGGGRDPYLVGYWPFDESAGSLAYDVSGNGNNATYFTGPVQITSGCKQWNCISFDGNNAYLNLGNPTSMKVAGAISAAAWIYPLDTRLGDFIIQRIDSASFGGFLFGVSNIASPNNKVWVRIADGSSYYEAFSTPDVSLNVWSQVAFTYNPPNELKMYINGVLTDTFNPNKTMTVNVSNGPFIGTTSWGYSSPGVNYKYYGRMDDLRLYNRALSAAEVSAIYNATK